MNDKLASSHLADMLGNLTPKTKQPASTRILEAWIQQAENNLGSRTKGGRLGWLVASSVAIAAVQRAVDRDGCQLFLLKGGTLLQHRLPFATRSTKDVDGLVRCDLDFFFAALESALDEPWGPLTLRRGPIETIEVPSKISKPRRFDIILELRGKTWRRIKFEISPDEAGIGKERELIQPPSLAGFGLPDPNALAGIAMRYQIAQKLHAVSDPHDPPHTINDRARDVVDLLLLRDLMMTTGCPTLTEVRIAGIEVFEARAAEARALDQPGRPWPPTVVAHRHWETSYAEAAAAGNISLSMDMAVAEVNSWISTVEKA